MSEALLYWDGFVRGWFHEHVRTCFPKIEPVPKPLVDPDFCALRTWDLAACIRYRGTSLIRNCAPLGPYSRTMPRVLGGSLGGGRFLMSQIPLYQIRVQESSRAHSAS